MPNTRRLVRSLMCVPLFATITFAQATLTPSPKQPTVGQLVNINISYKGYCKLGRISYGDGSKDGALIAPIASSSLAQHTYAAIGWFNITTYGADPATAANCKGGPITVQVIGTGTASTSGHKTTTPASGGTGADAIAGPATITIAPSTVAAGQSVRVTVRVAGQCNGGMLSFGDKSKDYALEDLRPGMSEGIPHVFSAGTWVVSSQFGNFNALKGKTGATRDQYNGIYTANCKGGPVTVQVAGASTASNSSAVVPCSDGTTSRNGAGGCAGHGGVAAASANAPPAPNANTAGTTVTCKDGTTVTKAKGACQGHGGYATTSTTAAVPPAPPAPPPAPNTNTNTSGTGTPCNDGTMSNATGKGACAHHGGIKSASTAVNPPPAPPTSPNTNATGTTVACKDGTTVTKAKGACKGHGGYADSSSASPNSP